MEARTLLAAAVGPSSTTTPTFQHYKVDAATAPQVPNSGTSLQKNLNGGGLQFNFVTTGSVPQQVIDGFVAAGKLWSDIFTDDIVVNVQIGYAALGSGILGQTGSTSEGISYSSFRTNLTADSKSADDATAVSHLPAGPSLSLYTSSFSSGFPGTPLIDNNNTRNNNFLDLNTAQSKALGLRAAGDATFDAQMTFSSNFTWDFDRSNGIASNAYDFVGVAAHEIGHALGFVSGADTVDYTTGFGPQIQSLNNFAVVSGLDLFRYSTASIANGTNLDLRADTATKFFSIDGGATQLTTFSTGSYNGDGSQASHWKDNLTIGIMDPTLARGELPIITTMDIRAFDVMGWDVRAGSGTNTAPVLNDQTMPNLNENVANGTAVGTVAASDVDANQQLTYSIIDGNTGNAFAINSTTGVITVNNRLAVDFETNPIFQLTVQVTDSGSPRKSDTGFVMISLTNLNDLDFGDLPDSFGTLLAANGARHQTGSGLFLGTGVTNELNGQPGTTATLDSDDGVTAPATLAAGANAQFTVTTSQAGRLDVFIDFNGNGVFESTERTTSVGGLIVNAGSNVVTVSVPSNASVGQRGARFRLSSIGGLNATGLASDGEVEDYFVSVVGSSVFYDFGDLPDSFGTLLASNGARHQTFLSVPMRPMMGSAVDSERDGQPSPLADADGSPTWGDENGVTLPATLTPGTTAQFSVDARHGGKLDAFIDFNGNGVFDANERVTPAGGLAMSNIGTNNFTVNVPGNAVGGQRGARFRISTDGGLAATGLAADGEVEDYFVTVAGAVTTYDFGDLPDTFGTLLASNGPRHQTGGGLFLGNSVSSEPDGQPDSSAFLDRDEGVTPEILGQGSLAYLSVRASQAGKLDAFIDFNGNGRFDTDERVTPAGGMDLTAGSNVLRVLIPTNAAQGNRGARFRISSAGGLGPLGPAVDGEVEDYFFYISPTTYDFGDLPDTFGTLLSSNGPRHNMPTRVFLGGTARSDLDGQPSALADAEVEDDGVISPTSLAAGSTATFSVTTTVGGKLDAFIDFNGNGEFDTNERVTPVGGLVLAAGANDVSVNVPGNAVSGQRGARFRLSTAGGLAATGPAVDGEVEDYFVTVAGTGLTYDFGDLPDTYGTLLSSNGARHEVLLTGRTPVMGGGVDGDIEGQPSALADGDGADEDGVTRPASLTPGTTAQFSVNAPWGGKLDAFIDFNGNGVFDTNERVTPVGGKILTSGLNTVLVNVPSNAVAGQRGARFRTSTAGGLAATGPAADGEVEDYFVTVVPAGPTYDFGDLPNTFGTTLASNGARHQTGGSLFLGSGVTNESDGKPSATANLDADDGVTIPVGLTKGTNAQFTVKASQAGKLDAFIDFNGNGVFDTNERVTPAGGLAVMAGNNIVTVSVPSNAVSGQRGARFRLSTTGGLTALGQAANGEVEDYFVSVVEPPTYDFGDLPNTFGTLLANDGARHQTGGGLFLGAGVTNETDGKPNATASLDTDDGVTAPVSLAPRVNAQFKVNASKAGKLDAFIDFNGNGVFEPTERVTPAGGQSLVPGQNTVNVTVPDAAVAGRRAARFRISTAGGLAATGLAADGEVEDYFVNVVRYDYGDLPNTFGTALASNGARHEVGGGLFLGTAVTSEADGQPSSTASLDSDDGVTVPAKLTPQVNAQFKVNASKAGKLDAFIDFNGNGKFDANERVTPTGGLSLMAGVNTVNVTMPDTAVAGQRGARFRISTVGGLAATGVASDGEVEDYFVNVVRYDFGDLPDTFGTTLASNGARHQVGSGLFMGTAVTSEANGQPSPTANLDSDDGVTLPEVLLPQTQAQFSVKASKAGKLDAFIDFNGNGVFDTNERVTPAGGLALTAGLNTVTVTVPATAVTGQRATRFRLSTAGGLAAKGEAIDGEVEDYFVNIALNDFGDLPDTFGTTLAQDGARHLTGGGLFLGASVTGEINGLPSAQANQDSDDGVTFSSTLITGLGARMNVTASQAGKLDAFIDFNGNGAFDANERVTPAGGLSLTAGTNSFVIPVPETTSPGQKAARFRLSSAGGLSAKGAAADGEVEDYFFNVVSPAEDTIQLLPDPDSPGQQLIYIRGTSGNDTISVAKTNLGFVVRMNNKVSPDLNANSRILIYGGDGKDKIALPTSIPLSAIVDGGSGNDSLWGGNGNDLLLGGDGDDEIYARGGLDTVYGGQGNDTVIGDARTHVMFGEDGNDKITGHGILVGGVGEDSLKATGSRNVLIGGEGADWLTAALGGDLLIGGTTNFDTNSTALQAIFAEWSADIAVTTRIAHLTGSESGGLNGSFFLVSDAVRPGTVHNDLAIDTIVNTFAEDWLLLFSGDRRSSLAGILNHS